MKRKYLRLVLRSIALLIAIIGSSVQVKYISDVYFQYLTVNEVMMTNTNIEIPKMTFCASPENFLLPGQNLSDWDRHFYYGERSSFPYVLLNESLTNMTIADVLFFKNAHTVVGDYLPLEDLMVQTRFMKNEKLCFAVQIKPDYTQMNANFETQVMKQRFVFEIQFLPYFTKHLTEKWFVHAYRDGFAMSERYIFTPNLTDLILSIQYYRADLKPYPYNTNCRDYNVEGLKSQSDAFEICVKKGCQNLGIYPPFLQFNEDENVTILSEFVQTREHYDQALNMSRVIERCTSRALKTDCRVEVFVPTKEQQSRNGRLTLMSPSHPKIITISQAKIDLIDFVTYILSSISFWFAFSPFSLISGGFLYDWLIGKFYRTSD